MLCVAFKTSPASGYSHASYLQKPALEVSNSEIHWNTDEEIILA